MIRRPLLAALALSACGEASPQYGSGHLNERLALIGGVPMAQPGSWITARPRDRRFDPVISTAGNPDAAASPDATDSSTISGLTIAEMPGYGQSNSIGAGATAGLSSTNGSPTAAPYYNLVWNGTALEQAYNNGANVTEDFYYGTMNELASEELSGGRSYRRLMSYTGGVGSQNYSQLRVGTGNWTTLVTEMGQMHTACETLYEPTYACRLMLLLPWYHGEADSIIGTTRAAYVTDMLELWTEWCAVAQASPYSLASCPVVVITQPATTTQFIYPTFYSESAEVVAAGYEVCRDYPTRFVCLPGYASPVIHLDLHYTATGHRLNGIRLARVARAIDLQRTSYATFQPTTITCADNVVTISLAGGPLGGNVTQDTTNVSAHADDGFVYTDSGTDVPAISSIAYGANSVTLTLSRNCVAPARVSYAWIGEACVSGGSSVANSAGGNIRRANAETTYLATSDYDWLTPFDQAVASVTGSASPTWTYANTGSLDITGTTSWLSAQNSTVTQGATDITWTFRFRTSSFADGILLQQYAGAGNRIYSFRSVTSGRIRVYMSSNGAAAAYQCVTPSSTFAINTVYQIVGVLTGSTFTLYSNGSAVTCTTESGSPPATLSAATAAISIMGEGSTNGTGNNGNANALMSHIGIIRRALSAAEVMTIYNGGTASDLRTYNFSHYWHGQGGARGAAYEDVGRATSKPLRPYGTGNTFSGTAL